MAHFKKVTTETRLADTQNAVLMGRKTWESIPPKFRPLKDRINVVLTRNPSAVTYPEGVLVASSLQEACTKLEDHKVGDIFVIGGSQIYDEAIQAGYVNKVFCTNVDNLPDTTKFDAFFPELKGDEWDCSPFGGDKENAPGKQTDEKSGLTFEFVEYTRKEKAVVNTEEMQYLDLCREILETGVQRGDRTGTGTLSKFGTQMRFSLRDGTLPLLTTKRTFWRGVAEELLWFVAVRYLRLSSVFSFRIFTHQNSVLGQHQRQ
jgi:dihydrofolate reductase / thymidylate synthase